MATKSMILEELKREETKLAQELAKYKPAGRRKAPQARAPEQSAEEKAEIRKAKSRIAYKQRQLAFYSNGTQQEEDDEEPQAVYVPNPAPAPAKKARKAPVKQTLPEPPQQQQKGVQMVFVPGDGSDMGYEETVEVDDDDGFDPNQ